MEYTRAKYVDRLVERKQNGLIKVITGARRSGKSYLMNELYYLKELFICSRNFSAIGVKV